MNIKSIVGTENQIAFAGEQRERYITNLVVRSKDALDVDRAALLEAAQILNDHTAAAFWCDLISWRGIIETQVSAIAKLRDDESQPADVRDVMHRATDALKRGWRVPRESGVKFGLKPRTGGHYEPRRLFDTREEAQSVIESDVFFRDAEVEEVTQYEYVTL